MRHGSLLLLILALAAGLAPAQEKIVATVDGTSAQTTRLLTLQDNWELRWHGASQLTITVANPGGSAVAGTTATSDGSLYQAGGGTFYLQVTGVPASGTKSWHLDVVQLAPGGTGAPALAYVPPATLPPPSHPSAPSAATPPLSAALTNAPAGVPPAAATASVPHLTEAQTRAVVLIQGDLGAGTGFLTHDKDGTPVVVTNHHVLFANSNLKITTTEGREIPVLAYRGATDRDLVMLTIKDDHYAYLETAADVDHLVHEDDAVLTPGNSEGGGVFLDTTGEIRAIGPQDIEISNPFFHGNSGGPVLHVASGKVVGVVTRGEAVKPTDQLDAASLANSRSAISGSMRYFAERIDTVPAWEPYDWTRFLNETTFLHRFHKQSRLLDSMLNGARYEAAHQAVTSGDEGYFPNSRLYQEDDRLRGLAESYHQQTSGADKSQQMDAMREVFSDLSDYASTGMADIQRPENFYQFDRLRAKEEISYRQSLIDELGKANERIGDLGH